MRWTWEPRFRRVLTHVFGRRNEIILNLLKPYNFRFYCTEHLSVYATHRPTSQHVATKKFTQGIERQNLTFRTRLKRLTRKTICFLKSVELHDKAIGEFKSREHYPRSNTKSFPPHPELLDFRLCMTRKIGQVSIK